MEFELEKLYAGTNGVYKILGLVLIIIGIAGATYPFWGAILVSNGNALEKLGASEIQAQALTASPSVDTAPDSDLAKINLPEIKNRLTIASAGIDMPLFLSANEKALLKGGWMYSGNSTPDKGGNTVIFGHRWLYKPPISNTMFNLDKVAVGDNFTISWNGKTYNYQVSEVKIVEPNDVWIMNPSDTPQVTLITCTPLFSTKQRLVVIGKLIK